MEIVMIAAIGKNRELGKNNQLIWHLPKDLAFFKKITMGHTIVMGRKTFESLPKLLPGRKHVVLSRNQNNFPEEVLVYHNIQELLKDQKEDLYIIGGEQIYKQFLEYATIMYLTEIDALEEADAFFPFFETSEWNKTILEENNDSIPYKHVMYKRK